MNTSRSSLRLLVIVILIAVGLSLLPLAASAQVMTGNGGQPCSLLGLSVGAASAGSSSGLALGAAAGWGLEPWLGLEARGSWQRRPDGESALTAGLSAQFRARTSHRVAPFVRVGVGLQLASFDLGRRTPPEFYGRRDGDGGFDGHRTFRDPALIVGGGVELLASRRVTWRPEVEAYVLHREGRNYVVAVASLQMSVHFERHHITPHGRTR
jgi:hypothetical protein